MSKWLVEARSCCDDEDLHRLKELLLCVPAGVPEVKLREVKENTALLNRQQMEQQHLQCLENVALLKFPAGRTSLQQQCTYCDEVLTAAAEVGFRQDGLISRSASALNEGDGYVKDLMERVSNLQQHLQKLCTLLNNLKVMRRAYC